MLALMSGCGLRRYTSDPNRLVCGVIGEVPPPRIAGPAIHFYDNAVSQPLSDTPQFRINAKRHGFDLVSVTEPDLCDDASRKLMRRVMGGFQ